MKMLSVIMFLIIWSNGWGQNAYRDSIKTTLTTDLSDEDRLRNLMIVTESSPTIEEFYSYQKQSLLLAKKLDKSFARTRLKVMEGRRYFDQQDDAKGMQIMMDELKQVEAEGDSMSMSHINYALGVHFFYKTEFEQAETYMRSSADYYPSTADPLGKANNLMAVGVVLQNLPGKLNEALQYHLKAIKIKEDVGSIQSLPISLNNSAELYYELGEHEKAYAMVDRSIAIADSFNEDWGVYYAKFIKGEMYLKEKRYVQAVPLMEEAVDFWESEQSWKDLTRGYELLSRAYKGANMPMKAMDAMSNYIVMKDSVYNLEKTTAAKDIATKYETEKKEILLQKEKEEKEFAQKESELIQKASRTRMIVFIVIGILLIFNALYFYKRYKDQQKDKELIALQKEQIEVRSQEIMDSIVYAKRIQSAILPRDSQFKKLLPDSFIFYKPKDVVAGDFYWLEQTSDSILFAAADCTGHGVPGAMVSVVCNNGLNRSVRQHGCVDPADILNKTRELVVEEFNKAEEQLKDGMDIALVSLGPSSASGTSLKYAGAHNPLWIIRQGSSEIEEIKADKQPIGRFEKEFPFTSHTVELKKNDQIYIFSDGYSDQFGGEKGKKLKAANFKKMLLSIAHLSMDEQKSEINNAFEIWKGELEQLDDVCVIGVKI
ncbi:MAG: SpoIIE family protein phosphatase [Crocinitomicaceae bacterium]